MKAFAFLPVLSACTLISHAAAAQSIIEYDFEDGSTVGWAVHSPQSHPYLTVVDDPLRGATNKVLKVDATYGGLDAVRMALPESLSSGVYELKMQFMVSGSNGGAASPLYGFDRRISFLDSSAATNRTATYIRYRRPGAYNEFNAYNGNGAGGGSWDGAQPLAYDQWYEITQTIDMDNKSWNWSVQNLTTGTGFYQSEELGFFHGVTDIRHLIFLKIGDASTSGLFYLDNVRMAMIPEPTSTAYILMGGLVGAVGIGRRLLNKSNSSK